MYSTCSLFVIPLNTQHGCVAHMNKRFWNKLTQDFQLSRILWHFVKSTQDISNSFGFKSCNIMATSLLSVCCLQSGSVAGWWPVHWWGDRACWSCRSRQDTGTDTLQGLLNYLPVFLGNITDSTVYVYVAGLHEHKCLHCQGDTEDSSVCWHWRYL